MARQIIFAITLLITLSVFSFTATRIIRYFLLTRKGFPVRQIGRRFSLVLKVAIGQVKIFRRPLIGTMHALVFWGFCVILFGSIEMIADGLTGTEQSLSFIGPLYDLIIASGDIFALIVSLAIVAFLVRRIFLHIRRFEGIEMKKISHIDANVALAIILLLMISLLGMNTANAAYSQTEGTELHGIFPLSNLLTGLFAGSSPERIFTWREIFWWTHIQLILIFANLLPYSKHFHVFMSVPNVFLTRLEPLGKLTTMESITREVKQMMDPITAYSASQADMHVARFGIKDAEDATWKNYFDSLACTECGRCTDVCPANITGKRLSPRKVMMDLRARMKEKGPGLLKSGTAYTDSRSLLRDYITEEELWACTTCNACAMECPININHPTLIVDMRRYLVMEEGAAPGGLKAMFSNIENNGAPWQYSPDDRLQWSENNVPVMANLHAKGQKPEYLFWVGCAGAYDDRYKKVVRAFVKILDHLQVSYAVLGKEESCSGDPARRAGNEMLYQIQALQNIGVFEKYGVQKILTICPHCYNIFKNEYPDLGGNYEVVNYIHFLDRAITEGKLSVSSEMLKDAKITYHDPCYLGRANEIYAEPRSILKKLAPRYTEMERNRSFALCCGAGGAQMFKEAEQGTKEVYMERTEEALATGASVIASACPFCMTMITDGIKYKNREQDVKNYDIAELIAQSLEI
jgi:Fe-S oxidoreductase/nitrate reductase gamma subunit